MIADGLVNAVHDLSDGGLAVALAEMALPSPTGPPDLALALREARPIGVAEAIEAMAAAHAGGIAGQLAVFG